MNPRCRQMCVSCSLHSVTSCLSSPASERLRQERVIGVRFMLFLSTLLNQPPSLQVSHPQVLLGVFNGVWSPGWKHCSLELNPCCFTGGRRDTALKCPQVCDTGLLSPRPSISVGFSCLMLQVKANKLMDELCSN